MQLAKAALPAGELEFDGQAIQVEIAEAATAVEYFPVPQSVHSVTPAAVEYVPATQSVHAANPVGTEAPEVLVKFTPRTMASAMPEVVFVLRYSSTTKTPAMSPLNSLPTVVAFPM